MKYTLPLVACATLSCLVFGNAAASAGSVTRRSPDSLYYLVRNNVGPTEFGPPTINGTFQFQFVERGETVRETMVLRVSGLETNSTVSLTAGIGDDPANVVTAAHLPTDRRGRVNMTFVTRNPPPARPSRTPLVPELMSPLTDVGAICMEDSTGQLIANAGVQDAFRFQYVVRRNLVPADAGGTAAGSISLTANQRRASLTLLAGGLTPDTEYVLAMNGVPLGTATSDGRGMLRLRGWPADAPPVLQLRSLALTDSTGGTVLSTTFPR
jgi:hypothetical protein